MTTATNEAIQPPFKFEECIKQYQNFLSHFLTTFTSPSSPLASSTTSISTRHSSPAFDTFFQSLDSTIPNSADKKATLELAFKYTVDRAMSSDPRVRQTFDQTLNPIGLLIDGALWCKKHGYLETVSPVGLIENLLESETIHVCELIFTQLIDPRIDSLIHASEGRVRLLFFRLCNNLLRRLSKTTNTFFAGQISMKMSYICSVDERSAVNPQGKFNKENITIADDAPAAVTTVSESPITPAPKEEGEMEDDVKDDVHNGPQSRETFYHLLWSLQSFFSDPPGLKTPSTLEAFHRSAEAVLTKFESIPLVEKESIAAIISSNGMGVGGASATPSVFPKYLTGGRLLELQLRDAVFRREVALQLLIFLAHILNPLGNVEVMKEMMANKDNHATATTSASTASPSTPSSTTTASSSAASAAAAAQLAQTNLSGVFLPTTAIPPLRQLFHRTLRLYKLIPPFSFQFSEAFLGLLAREQKFWTNWKEQKCPPIERPALNKDALLQKVDVEQVAKEVRDKKAGVDKSKESVPATDSKKRKIGVLGGGAGGFGGGFARPKATFDPSASLKSSSGRLLMGTTNLAKLWDPTAESNVNVTEFLRQEERSYVPDLQYKYIQTLVDEEEEYQKVLEKKKAAESKTKESKDSMDEDEEDFSGDIQLKDMLKSDARKPWQFLRLCILTPTVQPTWLKSSSDDMGEDDSTTAPPVDVSGLDLFMRSEGSLQKLLDSWAFEKKKHDKLAATSAASAAIVASPMEEEELLTTTTAAELASTVELVASVNEPAITTPTTPAVAVSPTNDESSTVVKLEDESTTTPVASEEPPKKKLKREPVPDLETTTTPTTTEATTPTTAATDSMDTTQQ